MRPETHRIFADLLSLNGYSADPVPAAPQEGTSMNLFKSLWLLGGLESIDLRVGDEEEHPFGQTYGNDVASQRVFGKTRDSRGEAIPLPRAPSVANDARVAHC
jgi:hypothetical protein